MAIQYKRILLKVSGEALSGPKGTGFDEETIASICAGIKAAHDLGAQIGIVVGGGNFWRRAVPAVRWTAWTLIRSACWLP